METIQEREQLRQNLADAGCSAASAGKICALYEAGRYNEMLHQLKLQRCTLLDEMHESQRKVDRMDYLIRRQEKRLKKQKVRQLT